MINHLPAIGRKTAILHLAATTDTINLIRKLPEEADFASRKKIFGKPADNKGLKTLLGKSLYK